MERTTDDFFYERYKKIWNNNQNVVRSRINLTSADKGKYFLGGNPVPLTNDKTGSLLIQNHYHITPKLDGERFLMMLCPYETETEKKLKVCFITRDMDFYTIKGMEDIVMKQQENTSNNWGTSTTLPLTLLDGELMIKENKQWIRENTVAEGARFYYYAFDILYGPSECKYIPDPVGNIEVKLGQETSLQGKKVIGKVLTKNKYFGWGYNRRKNLLDKLLLPESPVVQNYYSILFKIFSKPSFNFRGFSPESSTELEIYDACKRKFNETCLNYSESVCVIQNRICSSQWKHPINLTTDGIIFVPYYMDYINKVWLSPMNTCYKWKPFPTIDLLVDASGDVFYMKNKTRDLQRWDFNIPVRIARTARGARGIYEFKYENNEFINISTRFHKQNPNRKKAIESNIQEIFNPVKFTYRDKETLLSMYSNSLFLLQKMFEGCPQSSSAVMATEVKKYSDKLNIAYVKLNINEYAMLTRIFGNSEEKINIEKPSKLAKPIKIKLQDVNLYKKEIYALKGSQWPLKQGTTEASVPQRGMILFEEGLIIDNDFKLLCICLRLLSTY